MSLYADIQKMTQILQTDESPKFIRRRDANTFKPNRKLKKPKPPRNIELFDCNDSEGTSQEYDDVSEEYFANENEIAASIKEANCGINYSNEHIIEQWKTRLSEVKLSSNNSNIKKNSLSDTESYIDMSTLESDTNQRDIEHTENILKKCKLDKNAVIRGLLRNHTITLEDLLLPNNCTDIKDKNNTNIHSKSISSSINSHEENAVKLVEYPEDPEVLVQPLQLQGIDESKYKDIDFTVPHIGKKQRVTPRQFFLKTDDESDFCFVKKDNNKE